MSEVWEQTISGEIEEASEEAAPQPESVEASDTTEAPTQEEVTEEAQEASDSQKSEEKPASEAEAPRAAEEEIAKKVILAKIGEDEVEYDPEALVPTTQNGEVVEAKLQDVINSYVGQSEIHNRIREATEKGKAAEATKAEADKTLQVLQSGVKGIKDQYSAGKFVGAVDAFIATIPDIDPGQLWNGLVQELLPQIQEIAQSSPEERERLVQANNQKYTESKLTSKEQQLADKEQRLDDQQYFVDTTSKYGLTTQQVEQHWQEVNAKIASGDMSQAEQTRWNSVAQDPRAQVDLAVDEIVATNAKKHIEGLLKEVNPDVTEDLLAEGVDYLAYLVRSTANMTNDQLKQKAKQLYGNRKAEPAKQDEAVQVLDEEPSSETVASDDRVVHQTKEQEIESYCFDLS